MRPGAIAPAANARIPAMPTKIEVGVYPIRRIIHGRTAQMMLPMMMRSAAGGRRFSVKAMAAITDQATI